MEQNKDTKLIKDWPQASNFKRSIRLEFTLYVSGIILLLMLVTGYVIGNQYEKTVGRNVVEKLLVQARSYSGPAGKLLIASETPDALLLNNICKKLSSDNPDVYWAAITDARGVFLAHTDIKKVISRAEMNALGSSHYDDMLREEEGFEISSDTIMISVPIRENQIKLGKLVAAASARSIKEARAASIIAVVSITAIMIFAGIPLTMIVLHRKLRPVSIITSHLKHVDFNDLSLDIPLKNKNEFGYLAETLRVMGMKLNLAQKDMLEKERISRELEIAREIQSSLLPKAYPKSKAFEVAGSYRSAKEVGGDYYDFIEFDSDHLGLLVADVSGKSLPGMLVMLLTRDIVKRITRTLKSPDEILSELNRELSDNIKKGMFVTMFLGIIDLRNGRFSFASAGHNPLILYNSQSGESELIKTRGYPLGMLPTKVFRQRVEKREISLSENDWIVQYTDGINEAQNEAGEEYGLERFVNSIEISANSEAGEFIRHVSENHDNFVGKAEQYDDITVLALKWRGCILSETNQNNREGSAVYVDTN
jgi:serine phosphatase RsbU (regulator of sigma subunit)